MYVNKKYLYLHVVAANRPAPSKKTCVCSKGRPNLDISRNYPEGIILFLLCVYKRSFLQFAIQIKVKVSKYVSGGSKGPFHLLGGGHLTI